jgi:RHS repeat-associated protein
MSLLKILQVAITNCVLVLLGIAGAHNKTGASGKKGDAKDGANAEGDSGEQGAKEADGDSATRPDQQTCTGDPVNVVTGAMVIDIKDFELPGPIPLIWRRNWYSNSGAIGHLGHGFSCNFEMGLDISEKKQINVVLADGRLAVFPYLLPGDEFFDYKEGLLLQRKTDHFCLFDPKTRYSYLLYQSDNGYTQYKLATICNAQGHNILVKYSNKGYLAKITDSAGRELGVTTNSAGRITQVVFGSHVLVQYRYNNQQDLTEVIDAAGQATCMIYQNHLMVQKTDRNKNSFYWKYDNNKTGARVTETWGDGNVLYRRFEYHDDEHYNIVTDSLGNPIEYHYDERKLCTKTVYADDSETSKEYNERYELVREIDEEGRVTSYTYNDRSQLIGIERADGSTVTFEHDEFGRLISQTNPEGASKQWVYNDDDTLQISIDENGTETVYSYNENKQVKTVTNAVGDTIYLDYGTDGNLSQVNLPDGSFSSWEYDSRGNCTCAINPLGAVRKNQYDSLNRLVKAALADGNEIQLEYNSYDDVVCARDKQTEVLFEYTVLGNLKSRIQCGRKVEFNYNTEEQLVSIINEKGEIYQFERDIKGYISKEVGYDGVTREYERDFSGLLQEVKRPGNRFTRYQHDPLGNIIRADYHDGTWDSFGYNKNSELIEAANRHTALKFERNPIGKIVKEWQNDHWVESVYDKLGNRIQISSSLGAKIDVERNQMGRASHVAASQAENSAWTAQMQYNKLGQEIERMLPGDVISHLQYDATGRPTQHSVKSRQQDTRCRKYDWDINDKLKRVTNALTGTYITYGYDEFSNLIWSSNDLFSFIHRSADEVGNLYEMQDKTDRIYGTGSRLEQSNVNTNELKSTFQDGQSKLISKGTEYTYDVEGNLICKVAANGDVWQYEYYGNDMLSKVVLPGSTEVAFKYDPLGRRIEKQTPKKIIEFIWDKNNPLHELENEELITWVFDDWFVPTAKIAGEANYSIVSDYLGTPVEAYDADGKCIWSAEHDIYGRIIEFTGEVDFIPFRYQGQYHDLSSGLYYNRFRYYDPESGMYTQQDPIRLAGGNPTLYGYVHDPNTWIDPLGLAECSSMGPNRTPAQVEADNLQSLPGKERPNTVSVIETSDGQRIVGVNQQGVHSAEVQTRLDVLGNTNDFDRQCSEVNAISAARNKGIDLTGANISTANVRGPNSTSGIHGSNKIPCNVCEPLINSYGMNIVK